MNDRLAAALADRYRIERELGAGGMATVYLADDLKHDRKVAIKVLRPELAAVIGAERFVAEIRTTANLQHPHILPLFDSGVADSFLFYVMPYIDGISLRDRITREQQLPVTDAVRIATEVAGALDYAHRHGVIHRDIKPENILLHDGSALVADFGIALAASKSGSTRMTETGMSLGTPQYMSPEQAMGEREITPRSDVFGLGCITYEMLAGEPPFTGPTAQAIVAKVMTEAPKSLTAQRHSVPHNVDATVRTALEKLPADRFASAAGFAAALADERYPGSTGAARSAASRTAFWQALSAAAISAAAVLAVLLVRAGRQHAPANATSPWRSVLTFPDSAAPVGDVDLSSDGNSIVYRAFGDHGMQLWVRDAASLSAVPIPRTNIGPVFPVFSPDGKRVAFWAGDSLRVVPRDGSAPPVGVALYPNYFGLAWRDNDHVIIGGDSGLVSVPVNGGAPVRLTTVDTAHGEWFHSSPAPLPDGKGILFNAIRRVRGEGAAASANQIALSDPATGRHTVLMSGYDARYVAPGYLLAKQLDGALVAVPFDLARRRLTGAPRVVLAPHGGGGWTATSSATGRLIYPVGSAADPQWLVHVARDGSARVVDSAWNGGRVILSPDGNRLALSVTIRSSRAIVIRDLQSGATTALAVPPGSAPDPLIFFPDGKSVLFNNVDRSSVGAAGIFRGVPGRAALPERLSDSIRSEVALSGDGRTFFYTGSPSLKANTAILAHAIDQPRAPDRVVLATSGDLSRPVPSPDGRWLAYISDESGREELYVRSLDPSRPQQWPVSRGGVTGARWSRDGRELFYTTDFQFGSDSMMAVDVAPGPEFRMLGHRALFSTTKYLTGSVTSWDVLPKNGEFLMEERTGAADAARHQLVMVEQWQSLLHGPAASHE